MNKKTRNVTWFLNYNILQKKQKNYTIEQKEKRNILDGITQQTKKTNFQSSFLLPHGVILARKKNKRQRPNSNKKYLLNAAWPKKLKKVKLTSNIYARFWLPIIKIQKKTKKTRYYLNLMKSG